MLKFHEGLLTGSLSSAGARKLGCFFEALGSEDPGAVTQILELSDLDGQAVHALLRSLLLARAIRNVRKTRRGEHTRQVISCLGQEIANVAVDAAAANLDATDGAARPAGIAWR